MANTGNVFVGTGETVARGTNTDWTNPGNIVSDNATDATCVGGATGSDYLVGRNADLSVIPDGAIIDGVTVRVEASEHSSGTEVLSAQLQNDSAALIGNAKTATVSGTAKAVYTYGGTADTWGAALTSAIVKHPNFGGRFWFTTAHDVRVDYATLAVEYHTQVSATATALGVALILATPTVVTHVSASATLLGEATITAVAEAVTPDQTVPATASLLGSATILASPTVLVSASATVGGTTNVTVLPTVLMWTSAVAVGATTITVTSSLRYWISVVVEAESSVSVTPTVLGGDAPSGHGKGWRTATLGRHGRHRT